MVINAEYIKIDMNITSPIFFPINKEDNIEKTNKNTIAIMPIMLIFFADINTT